MKEQDSNVVDMQVFRARKQLSGERRVGLQQAFRPTNKDVVRLHPKKPLEIPNSAPDADLTVRIERIKSSILRINQLMAELRSTGNNHSGSADSGKTNQLHNSSGKPFASSPNQPLGSNGVGKGGVVDRRGLRKITSQDDDLL